MNITIIDDVVDKATQDEIEKRLLSGETQWTFARSIFYDKVMHPEVEQLQKKRIMSFTKLLVSLEEQTVDPTFSFYNQPLKSAKKNHGIDIKRVLNSRIQLQLPLAINQEREYGIPHIDAHRDYPYKVGVYYVNDVDGDTYIFNQTETNSTPEDIKNGKVDVYTKISPKKGRLVIFDGDVYHSVGKPKTDLRCIINYNFTIG